jgi:hypothetical protein
MPASSRSLQRQPTLHPHAAPSQCPYCDQPIPVERAAEVQQRIDARERDQAEKLSAKIRQELAWEKAQGEAAVRSKIVALEAANTALQEAMSERLAAAGQQMRSTPT